MFSFISFPELFLVLPVLSFLFAFILRKNKLVLPVSLILSLITLAFTVMSLFYNENYYDNHNKVVYDWLPSLGASMTLLLDGLGKLMCLLTAIVFSFVILLSYYKKIENLGNYLALLFLMQLGLMGVFLAYDAFLFYFFWELVLIPAYFLASLWGNDKSVRSTFKFYIYTFLGSILLLVGIIYLYSVSPNQSFRWESLLLADLSFKQQLFVFSCFFLAFAIKIPLVPFHSWQPDTYSNAPLGVTIILSAVMVKMGLFAMIRWVLPFFPLIFFKYSSYIILLSIIGMLYASLIAFKQVQLRRFVAYVSIAHIALMNAAIFSNNEIAINGVIVQMFNHGINILGLWILVDWLESKLQIKDMSELKALAKNYPSFALFFMIILFGNIAVPLTNGFVGEFLMLQGIFKFNMFLGIAAGLTIILGAAYMLIMYSKLFYGKVNETAKVKEIPQQPTHKLYTFALGCIVAAVIFFGIYPQPLINISNKTVKFVILANQKYLK